MTLDEFKNWFKGFVDGCGTMDQDDIERVLEVLKTVHEPVSYRPVPYFPDKMREWNPFQPYWAPICTERVTTTTSGSTR